jgi:ribosomal protein S18 acetylase RimI-like enzyme
MLDNFRVVKGEVEEAIKTMREVASWGRSVGLKVWKDEILTRENLLKHANEDEFCIGQVSGNTACCMILQWEDTLFWPNVKKNESGYVHKLCVRKDYASQGFSGKLIEFAIEECKEGNIKYLRLDTGWTKTKLCNLYKSLGFEIVDKILLDDGAAFALFEIKIE